MSTTPDNTLADPEQHVKIVVEPLPAATGFGFVDAIVGGAVPNPSVVTVKRWTLSVPKSYAATWHEDTLQVDTSKP